MTDLTRSTGTATTLNRDARTVEVTAVSGYAPGPRNAPAPDGSRTAWIEELDPAAIAPAVMVGMPVLRDHKPTTDSAIGTVTAARLEGSALVASIRFDGSAAADELMGKVEAGSVKGISVGYRVQTYRKFGTRDGLPVFRATKWQPRELSFTPLPFDPGATVRNSTMSDTVAVHDGNDVAVNDNGGTVTRADTNREIRSIAKAANLPATWADQHIDAETDLDSVRKAAFAELTKRSSTQISTVQVVQDHGDPLTVRSAMADALSCRLNPKLTPEGRAVEYMGADLLSMAGELSAVRGQKLSRNRITAADELFQRSAHSTSDFPLLLENAVNKAMLPGYTTAAPTYRKWASQRSFNDFRPHKFLRIGDFPALQEIGAEGGEPNYGTVSENRESVTAKEFGTGISISRKALVNDDLGALQNFTGMIGVRVAADENALAYGLLNTSAGVGPLLSDGVAMFASAHGNIAGSGGAISTTTVAAAVQALRLMTSLDGIKLNIAPRFLVCGPAYELIARQLLAAIIATQASNVNPWSGLFELIIDANITGNHWYLFADPGMVPNFVFGYVSGSSGPVVRSEIDFDTRAFKVAVGLDFGVGAIDYRGAYFNAGA